MVGFAGETANLAVVLKLDDSGFASKLSRARGQVAGFGSSLSQMGRGVGQVGSGLSRLGTRAAIAAAGGLAAVVTTAVSFEDAFAGVEKTVDGTEAELDSLRETFRKMAREIPVSFESLSALGETAGALGIAVADIDEFVKVAATLGVTTDVSAEQAATSLGVLSNVLHLTGADYDRFADVLVRLGNEGASTESAILAIAERAGASANLIGINTDNTLAWSAAVANLGIEVEAGGTAIQKFFLESLKNIQDDDTLQVMAETAGVTGVAFKDAFGKDASGALRQFVTGLGELSNAEQLAVLDALGFSDIRITRTLLGLAGNVEATEHAFDELGNAAGAASKEAEKRFATTASQIQKLKNNVRDAAFVIGSELLPVTNELITEFVGELNKPATQAGLKAFAQDLAGGVRGLIGELKGTDFSGLLSGMKFAADAAKLAFDAFRSLPPDIQAILVGAFALNKVSGGAISQLVKGVGNIVLGGGGLAGGLLSRGSLANPMFVTVTNPSLGGGGPGGGAIPVPTGGWRAFLTGAMKLIPIVGLEILLGEFASQFTRELNPSQFDFNQVAGQSGNFNTQQQAEAFAVATATRLGVPLDELKAGIVTGVTGGMTFDQAVAAFIVAVNDPKSQKPEGPPDLRQLPEWVRKLRVEGFASLFPKKIPDTALPRPDTAALPNTAMTALTKTPAAIDKLAPILTRNEQAAKNVAQAVRDAKISQLSRLDHLSGVIAAKDMSANVTANLTVNTFISGTMFAKQQSVVHVAAGRYAGKPVPLS